MEIPDTSTKTEAEIVCADAPSSESLDDNNIIKIAVEDLVKLLALKVRPC